jgi:hypothetical protein
MQLKVIGLNQWARDLTQTTVEVQEEVKRLFPCGKSTSFQRVESVPQARVEKLAVIVHVPGGFSVDLQRYTFPDGRVFEEYVQHCEKNCDVHVFVALRDASGNPLPESLWQTWEIGFHSACYCRHTC